MIDEKKLIEELSDWRNNWVDSENSYEKAWTLTAIDFFTNIIKNQPKVGEWIPVSERLPEERDWYLAVFKEIDTDFVLIPRVADYVGKTTSITTSDNWIIIDFEEPIDIEYIRNLECIAWMPLPEHYKESEEE